MSAPDAFLGCDADGQILFASAQATELFGLAQSELLGANLDTLVHSVVARANGRSLADVLASLTLTRKASAVGDMFGRHADRSTFPVELKVSTAATGIGEVDVVIVRDVSDRTRAAAAARQLAAYRDAYFHLTEVLAEADSVENALIGALPSVVLPLGWDLGAIWLVEDGALVCRAVWGERDILADTFSTACLGVRLDCGESLAGEAWAAAGPVWRDDIREWDGFRQIEVAASLDLTAALAVPIRANNEVLGVLECFAQQIAPPNRLQSATFQGAADQLGQFLARASAEARMYEAMTELERSNAELEQFAYVASHDLQEPLRAIGGFVQLLQRRYEEELDERADRYIKHTVDGVARMQTLIDDLLVYSRAGRGGIERAEVPLGELVEDVLQSLGPACRDADARVEVGELPVVAGDRTKLAQVFQNLIANAIKFHRPGVRPCVRIDARRAEDSWLISVADNGIGIPADQAERVFRMFQRLQKRDEYPGTGIGLAIVKRIVELHGGDIECAPAPAGGTVFAFRIPAGA